MDTEPVQDYKVIIGNKSDEEQRGELERQVRSYRARNKNRELFNPELRPLPEKLQLFREKVEERFKEEFDKMGIAIPPARDDIRLSPDAGASTSRSSGFILIEDYERELGPNMTNEVREYILYRQACFIIHERYHQIATNISVTGKNSATSETEIDFRWRKGLSYIPSKRPRYCVDSAAEEGLAVYWEEEFNGLAREMFPEGAQFADKMLKTGSPSDIDLHLPPPIPVWEYYQCLWLSEWIMEKIGKEKYLRLVEQARAGSLNMGPLAEAFDEKFGAGSFNEYLNLDADGAQAYRKKMMAQFP